ncbi:MAG TPA: FtsX-like permease family protein [bacterium]|nr:FtsX-like permease family protein [bacterium]
MKSDGAFWRLLKIAGKNVLRNKRRSALTLLIIVVGSASLLLVGGFFDRLLYSLKQTFIHSQSGHFQVSRSGYFEKGSITPFNYLIQDAPRIAKLIEQSIPGAYTVPRIKFGGMLSSDRDSVAVIALGVDPRTEARMSSFRNVSLQRATTNIVEGKDLDDSDPYGIVLGAGLLKSLNLKVGDHVSFITTRQEGAVDGADFHIRGVFETVLKEVGERVVKVPLSSAQAILGLPAQVNSFLVVADDYDDSESIDAAALTLKEALTAEKMAFEIVPWENQSLMYKQTKHFFDNFFWILKFIISVIFIVSVANTINMALFERMREYGTMMAIGNSRSTIFTVIVLEAAILGLIGATLGVLIGWAMSHIIPLTGVRMPPPPTTGVSDWYRIYFLISPKLMLQVFAIAFFSTLFSSLIPAYRASHFRIVHALGYV